MSDTTEGGPKKPRRQRRPNKNPFPVTEEQIERLRPHQWKKGQSGNPKGSTKTNRELQELIREETPKAIERIIDIAVNGYRDSDRLKANMYLVNKIVSDAAQRHEHEHQISTSGDFLARVNAARQMLGRPTVNDVVVEAVVVEPKEGDE